MKENYIPTIGLEIHAELKTRTKMFCGCLNDPEEKRPNVNICPVCMAHPGTLPVINKEAVHKVLTVGTALGGQLADATWFDRKNYFYPDIPKGYQISQYKDPLVAGGELAGIVITRVHLEEDTARSQHQGEHSLVDFNRAGVPLMELVTEPVIHDAAAAGTFARELQLLLRYLEASEANMEMGQMRVEANISVGPEGELGTKTEVKNLNSFRSVERAIAYEIERQVAVLESGGKVIQETRGWDENKQQTFSQRAKESAHDYRYFPEPDLPELKISEMPEFSHEALQKSLPELPFQKRERYRQLGTSPETKMSEDHIELFVSDLRYGTLFEETYALQKGAPNLIANYIGSDIVGLVTKYGDAGLKNITAENLDAIMQSLYKNEISSRGAKDAIADIFHNGGIATEVLKKYQQQSDASALEAIAKKVFDTNPGVVADYQAGKAAALQFLLGQGMRESKGSANPQELKKVFEKLLGSAAPHA